MKFLLNDHIAFSWIKKENNFYFRGSFFLNNELYTEKKIIEILKNIKNEKDFVEQISKFNGNFIIILIKDEKCFIANDKIASFSFFYAEGEKEIILGDNAKEIATFETSYKLNKQALLEIASTGFTLGDKTLYTGVKILGPGECLIIDLNNDTLVKKIYYKHLHKENLYFKEKDLLEKLDVAIKNTFDRFIKSLEGRQVVLFLSGGYDSRLILINLYKRKYKDVVCISLKSRNDLDVIVAKELATKFSYKLLVVDYNKTYWKKRSQEKNFWTLMDKLFNGVAIYYPQGIVVNDLIKKNLIKKDSVIVTGNSGDVVEGNDVSEKFTKENIYSHEEVISEIMRAHCLNVMHDKNLYDKIFNEISRNLPYKNEKYTFEEAQDIYEYFNWYERQCKYVTSDVRNYDEISGNEWRLPLWDDEFVEFWLNVPIDYRYKRNLYYKYVKRDNLPTANKSTFYGFMYKFAKGRFKPFMHFFYPVRQITGYFGNDISYVYHGILSLKEWCYILWLTRGSKVKFISAFLYKIFWSEYKFNIFKKVKE